MLTVVGLMCGTSLDGIDAARVALAPRGEGYAVRTEAFVTSPLDDDLRERLRAAQPPAAVDARIVAELHAEVGAAFGRVALAVGGDDADCIASHGITLAHDGDRSHTLQIGDPFRIREVTGRTVVFDFRSADTAAGGQGAPLVPYVDRLLFASPHETRVALNLGGIANLTVLRPHGPIVAFDSGPANALIDDEVRRRDLGRFDRDGALARGGRVDDALLAALLADPYFRRQPPKSTGREYFGAAYLAPVRARLDALAAADAIATLTALTARSVADAIVRHAPDATRAIVAGGGARNPALLRALADAVPSLQVEPSDAHGVDADAKEAVAFALLGIEALRERAAGLPSVSGARGPRVLGAFAPAGLAALIARVRREAGDDEV
jgi:anhydro-N-acetylmuramic acid kinase